MKLNMSILKIQTKVTICFVDALEEDSENADCSLLTNITKGNPGVPGDVKRLLAQTHQGKQDQNKKNVVIKDPKKSEEINVNGKTYVLKVNVHRITYSV